MIKNFLFPHNQEAYQKVKESFKEKKRVAVVHATGTGKSFLTLQWLLDHKDKNHLFVAPTQYIISQLKKHIKELNLSEELKNLKMCTYASLMKISDEDYAYLRGEKTDRCIILDEFHRCGALEWGKGVQRLLQAYPQAQILGTSATPIRYLDNLRDMAEEIFDDNIASEITLADAINQNILPAPMYINAIYSFEKDLDRIAQKLKLPKNLQLATEYQKAFAEAKKAVASAPELSDIFAKYMQKKDGKLVVFCKNRSEMLSLKERASQLFAGVNNKIQTYSIDATQTDAKNHSAISAFENAEGPELKLMFAINMLNEGVHIKGVDGVVMLRSTMSKILYMQQLGRALSVSGTQKPLVFDITNNIDTSNEVYSLVYGKPGKTSTGDTQEDEGDAGESAVTNPAFTICDDYKKIKDILSSLEKRVSYSWQDMFNLTKEYVEKTKQTYIPHKTVYQGIKIGAWLSRQRTANENKTLSSVRAKKLTDLGIDLTKGYLEKEWKRKFDLCKEYINKKNTKRISVTLVYKGENIGNWFFTQKRAYNEKVISQDRVQAFKDIGIDLSEDVYEENWQANIGCVKRYLKVHKTKVIPNKQRFEGKSIGKWLGEERVKLEKGILQKTHPHRAKQLAKLVADLQSQPDVLWNARFALLQQVVQKQKLKIIPAYLKAKDKTGKDIDLAQWFRDQREAYAEDRMKDPAKRAKLESLGVVLGKSFYQYLWDASLEASRRYLTRTGSNTIPASATEEDPVLGTVTVGKWFYIQRMHYRDDKQLDLQGSDKQRRLTEDHKSALESLGADLTIAPKSGTGVE